MSVEGRIYKVSKNLKKISRPATLTKAALMSINSYRGTSNSLGNGPLNDGYHIAKTLNGLGYDVYSYVDGDKDVFLEHLKHFMSTTTERLVIYYIGHGLNVRDTSGDESDGKDEAMYFVDGPLVDDILVDTLKLKQPSSIVTLITDACHSGSIWDIQGGNKKGRVIPPNVLSFSAASDRQTAKQTVFEKAEQGVFSYFLRKALKTNRNSSPDEVKNFMRGNLRKYQQNVQVATSSQELLSQPLV
jgi:uncharacterized caspase-like protein